MLEKSFDFLSVIAKNNNREWYHANKSMYNGAKEEFDQFTEVLIHEIGSFDRDIAGLQPKDCIFRIFRDVRFSSDKSPYKTNFGCYMTKGGKKSWTAGYYFHLEPGSSFVAGGIYMPPSPWLKAIRKEIFDHTDEFIGIINEPAFKKHFGKIDGEQVKTAPQGYSKDFEHIELLKYKSYTVSEMKTDAALKKGELQEIMEAYKALSPFLQFLNQAVEGV